METKYKTLEDVRRFLDKVPMINCGGCGISALAMYRWLKKNFPEQASKVIFHFFHRDRESFENNESLIKNNAYNENNILIPAHIGFQIKNLTKIIDSEKVVKKSRYGYQLDFDSEHILMYAINKLCGWNDMFNREQSVPVIAKELGIDLSDVLI